MLDVHNSTYESGVRLVGGGREGEKDGPEEIDVKDLVPVVDTLPRGAVEANTGVVH